MSGYLIICGWLTSAILTYCTNYGKRIYIVFSWANLQKDFLINGIMYPFFEELLFRVIIAYLTSSFKYYKYLNALLFGLVHIPNIPVYGTKIGVIHVFNAMVVGYYLIDLNSFVKSFFVHSLLNISLSLVAYVYYGYI